MEYQKIINLLRESTNQPSKFRTEDWVEINDEPKGRYDNSNFRCKSTSISSSLCDYSDAYILLQGTVTVQNTAAAGAAINNTNKKVIFQNCTLFIDCITEINNTQIYDAQKVDAVMPIYNLIEYSDAYSRTSGILYKYHRDEPDLDNNGNISDDNNNSGSFKFKQKITGRTGNGCTKDVRIMVPLKQLINFWRTLEMPLINREISLPLKW